MTKKEAFAELAKSGRAGYSVIDTALDKIAKLEQQLAAEQKKVRRLMSLFMVDYEEVYDEHIYTAVLRSTKGTFAEALAATEPKT